MFQVLNIRTKWPRITWLTVLTVLLLGFAVFFWVRTQLPQNFLGNHDAAGIFYNADGLLRGEFPYLDTVEVKPPGSFFLLASGFSLMGRSVNSAHVLWIVWHLLGAAGVALAARILYKNWISTAIATAIYIAAVAYQDFNYSSWMTVAYVLAFAFGVASLRSGGLWQGFLAGAFSFIAFAIKGQAVVIAPVLGGCWLWARLRRETGATLSMLCVWVIGGLVAFAPLILLYLANDALPLLVKAMFPVGTVGAYSEGLEAPPIYRSVRLIAERIFEISPIGTVLSLVAIVKLPFGRDQMNPKASVLPTALFLAGSLVATAIGGFRFYEHYFFSVVPGVALLAAHPCSFQCWPKARSLRRAFAVGVVCCVLVVAMKWHVPAVVNPRYVSEHPLLDADGLTVWERIGAYINEHSRPEDRILAWGWEVWSVYWWADRRATGGIYKPLGTVTDFNTNTAYSASRPIHFKPGWHADKLVEEFRRRPPRFFVYSHWYQKVCACKTEPLDEFTELSALLVERYRLVQRFGDIDLYGLVEAAESEMQSSEKP